MKMELATTITQCISFESKPLWNESHIVSISMYRQSNIICKLIVKTNSKVFEYPFEWTNVEIVLIAKFICGNVFEILATHLDASFEFGLNSHVKRDNVSQKLSLLNAVFKVLLSNICDWSINKCILCAQMHTIRGWNATTYRKL